MCIVILLYHDCKKSDCDILYVHRFLIKFMHILPYNAIVTNFQCVCFM